MRHLVPLMIMLGLRQVSPAVALACPLLLQALPKVPSGQAADGPDSWLAKSYELPRDLFDLPEFNQFRKNGVLDVKQALDYLGSLSDANLPEAQRLFDVFAWKAFVALNWASTNAGEPDPSKDSTDAATPRVWERSSCEIMAPSPPSSVGVPRQHSVPSSWPVRADSDTGGSVPTARCPRRRRWYHHARNELGGDRFRRTASKRPRLRHLEQRAASGRCDGCRAAGRAVGRARNLGRSRGGRVCRGRLALSRKRFSIRGLAGLARDN